MSPLVSIICLAYNHKDYIRSCLDGILMQKTTFDFEVLIHDDASTDGTTEIIKEYERQYPTIIKGIYQTQNQYSKGIPITDTYIVPLIRGKFVAYCEGDDGWTDENKLQKQVSFLLSHNEYSMCVHNTEKRTTDNVKMENTVSVYDNECDFDTSTILLEFGSGLFHTSSFVFKSVYLINRPEEFNVKGIGDYPKAIYLSLCGKVHYFPDVMSFYRVSNVNSWTGRVWNNMEKRAEHCNDSIDFLNTINKYTSFKYNDAITKRIKVYSYFEGQALIAYKGIIEVICNKNIRKRFNRNDFYRRIKIIISYLLNKTKKGQ